MADCRRAVTELVTTHLSGLGRIVVAVSGGADSLALAWACAFVLPKHGFEAEAVIIDHGLQEGSGAIALEAKTRVEELGLPATIIRVDVDGSGNVEENARGARYDALEHHATAVGAKAVFLGHTLDDQAETVLLGLSRGSGSTSIRGMSPVRGIWARPFLGLRRETTRQACVDAGVSWWDDPHNDDRRFLRPRIRHDLMPALVSVLGPGVPGALAQTAYLVGQDDDYLSQLASGALETALTPEGELEVSALIELPEPIRRRVIRLWVREQCDVSLSFVHTEMVDALVVAWSGQGPVDISGHTLVRVGNRLRID
jgi:tRNA(Ile)-lysidine synthase